MDSNRPRSGAAADSTRRLVDGLATIAPAAGVGSPTYASARTPAVGVLPGAAATTEAPFIGDLERGAEGAATCSGLALGLSRCCRTGLATVPPPPPPDGGG